MRLLYPSRKEIVPPKPQKTVEAGCSLVFKIVVIPTPSDCGGRRNLLTRAHKTTVSPSCAFLRARACPERS